MRPHRTVLSRVLLPLILLLYGSAVLGIFGDNTRPTVAAPKRTPTPTPTRTPIPTPTIVPTPTATPVPPCNGAWNVIPSPNGPNYNLLADVAVVSATDIWPVGTANFKTLILHWDGAAWSIIPSPSPGSVYNYLNGVAAVATNDVWAVGYYDDETLILHWDGAVWSVVSSPNPNPSFNVLSDVAAISATDAWAVGYSSSATLTMHWDGAAWQIVSSPNPGTTNNFLYGVTARASNDVWAVGRRASSGSYPGTLTMRWDGTRWNVVASPNQASASGQPVTNELHAVSSAAANDVWAVGTSGAQTLALHWNGSNWSVLSSPNVADRQNFLSGVVALATNDVWAVGYAQTVVTDPTGEYEQYFPTILTLHWNGASWTIVASPNPSPFDYNILSGIAAAAPDDVWAVGYYQDSSFETLIERFRCR